MLTEIIEFETDLTLGELYTIQAKYNDITFEVYPVKREPLDFDMFVSSGLSQRTQDALWDIMEILAELVSEDIAMEEIEAILPANFLFSGLLEMPIYRAMSLIRGDTEIIPIDVFREIEKYLIEHKWLTENWIIEEE